MNKHRIAVLAVVMASLAIAFLVVPMVKHRLFEQEPPRIPSGEAMQLTTDELEKVGEVPLQTNCLQDMPDRIRYFDNVCFSQHIITIDIRASSGSIIATALGHGAFYANGKATEHVNAKLTSSQFLALNKMMDAELETMSKLHDRQSTPTAFSALEACKGGKYYESVVIGFDDRTGTPEQQLLEATGLQPGLRAGLMPCM